MRLLYIALALAGIVLAGNRNPLSAQTCRTSADTTAWLREKVGSYALATDSLNKAVRDSLGISPVTSASSITLVTTDKTCKSANTAYQTAMAGGQRQTFSGKVYVIQSGKSYVVWDPAFRYSTDPGAVFVVFDSRWAMKSVF